MRSSQITLWRTCYYLLYRTAFSWKVEIHRSTNLTYLANCKNVFTSSKMTTLSETHFNESRVAQFIMVSTHKLYSLLNKLMSLMFLIWQCISILKLQNNTSKYMWHNDWSWFWLFSWAVSTTTKAKLHTIMYIKNYGSPSQAVWAPFL